ncbi:hypothetical protein NliqN6_3852 [Naganishia liquefaciens]|uniref:Rab-GAP TBC domain-containing protein n=1 Tax=Naganishia liquefaciens TaxID=104408 RepID=A0A8H3TVG9_9TREE|nr:hypothetical protein NliqN6_3852 [Naganishia liquefaciens]
MGGGPLTTRDSDDLVQVITASVHNTHLDDHLGTHNKAHLLLAKAHVFVHPSSKARDHIPGYLGIAQVAADGSGPANSLASGSRSANSVVVFWIPTSLAEVLDEDGKYEAVSEKGFSHSTEDKGKEMDLSESDDYVFVTLPSATASSKPPPSSTASLFSASGATSPDATTAADVPDEVELAFSDPDALRKAKVDRERHYAWSVGIEELYSILVYPPSMSSWYGSVTINLLGGLSLPTLYFHDDESPSTLHLMSTGGIAPGQPISTGTATPGPSSAAPAPRRIVWGATTFFACLRDHCDLLRSRLEPRLFLVNPSKPDREVHEIDLGDERENDRVVPRTMEKRNSSPATANRTPRDAYPPQGKFPANPAATLAHGIAASASSSSTNNDLPPAFSLHPARTQLLSSFSQLTQKAKQLTQQVLSQPFAEPIVPHLPPNMRKMVDPSREWEAKARRRALFGDEQRPNSVASVTGEFESARVYLARWARVVAEEGERSRKRELANAASLAGGKSAPAVDADAKSDLGIFEVVRSARGDSSAPPPSTTRTPGNPVRLEQVKEWHERGLDESYLRGEIFRRGVDETDDTRKVVWEVLLGVIPWKVGLGRPWQEAEAERAAVRADKRHKYEELKKQWLEDSKVHVNKAGDDKEGGSEGTAGGVTAFTDKQREEWHRIDVDCRRTDRNQPMFAVPEQLQGQEEKEGGGAGAQRSPTTEYETHFGEAEEGSQTALNPHTAALRTILMTYHQYSPTLGYVQGMSDLLSPIYVVFEADEASSFWAFVGWMKVMEVNFLRDQSGMKHKLGTLQKLISAMDPQLYRKLERTHSTSLFMCFRWLLIAFKREFKFDDVIRLWDVLFTDYYSDEFVIFVALAILHSHREVIIRYLVEFDEVLKYANDLSETIDLESTLAQAEVLFLSFRKLVEECDRNEKIRCAMINAAIEEEERREEAAAAGESSLGGLRRRRGSHSSSKSAKSEREEEMRELIPDDLRELLINFKDHS